MVIGFSGGCDCRRDHASRAAVVWRVALQGPTGSEEVYVDEASGSLVDSIVQGQ
jgi:hypothetical protein